MWSYFITTSRPEHSHIQTYKSQLETSTDITIGKPISGDSRTLSHQTYKPIGGDKRKHQKTHRQTHRRRQAHLIGGRKLSSPLISNLTRVSLLLPHDLLSSSCRSNPDRPIAHSNLFFVVRSLVLSSVLLLLKYQNWFLDIQFSFLELKTLKLEIYVAFSVQLIQHKTRKVSL